MAKTEKYHRFSEEECDWIRERYGTVSVRELTREFIKEFDAPEMDNISLRNKAIRMGLDSKKGEKAPHVFTREEDAWIRENFLRYSYRELAQNFNEKFGTNIGRSMVYHCTQTLKLRKGVTDSMSLTPEQEDWIRENFSQMAFPDLADGFNQVFGTDYSIHSIGMYGKHALGLVRFEAHEFTPEEDEWIEAHWGDRRSYRNLTQSFNEAFGVDVNVQDLRKHAREVVQYVPPEVERFTPEEDEWLRENVRKYTKGARLAEALNETFGRNHLPGSVRSRIRYKKMLNEGENVGTQYQYYTRAQDEWLRSHFQDTTYEELTKMFNEEFGTQAQVQSLGIHARKLGLLKRSMHRFTPEEDQWLRKYASGFTYTKLGDAFNEHFGTDYGRNSIWRRAKDQGYLDAKVEVAEEE